MRKNRSVEAAAEDILKQYAKDAESDIIAEMDGYLKEDGEYSEDFKKYSKRRYVKPKNRILRVAVILLVILFTASIAVPVPQASAWRIWWLDLFTGENKEDVDVKSNDEDSFVEYYVSEIPEGFEIISETRVEGTRLSVQYENKDGKYISFTQYNPDVVRMHFDNEDSSVTKEIIGDFEVYAGEDNENWALETLTDNSLIIIETNESYEVAKKFMEKLMIYS